MDLQSLVEQWRDREDLEGEFVHLEDTPARTAINSKLDPPLPGALVERLAARGITELYRHQVRAIRLVREKRHTVIVSGTASGKTLCYQVPIAEAALSDPKTTSFLIFPTKALAQDQLRSLAGLRLPGLNAVTYDGDTDPDGRRWARRHANAILTNPDMLHVGILPNHSRWADFFLRLRYVVVDEIHVLRGIFGSHVAHVLRRLRRLAAHYGSSPTFVFTSATIGNPGELASRLSGLTVEVVAEDDSPTGRKLVLLWNPPRDPHNPDRRRSSLSEVTDLFVELVEAGANTIVFTRSRKATELVYRWASGRLGNGLRDRSAPYRGGYLAADRRRIEQRLFEGDLVGVVATNALELGVDVGSLDAAVLNSFPGTIASFRQQAGRAGRARDEALAVLVAGEDALDQYFMSHPSELFYRTPEAVVVNPDNPHIAEAQTGCALFEKPMSLADREFLPEAAEEAANRLVQKDRAELREGELYWLGTERPAPLIDIRTSGGPTYRIFDGDTGEMLGTVEQERAMSQTHPGAIYLHRGETYLVDDLDHSLLEVRVSRSDANYYTLPRVEQTLDALEELDQRQVGQLPYVIGRLRVERHVVGFQRRQVGTRKVLGLEPLDLPPSRFETQGVWYGVPPDVLSSAGVSEGDLLGTLHAAEHTGIAMLPLFAVCDRWDLGGLSTNFHPATGGASVFIYEAYPGGAGISPVAFSMADEHLAATAEALRTCSCVAGCPSCVQSPKCGNFNEPLSKHGALAMLEAAHRA
ncbi:MAG: DEAD/DEAH box helicase [Acidimicrobiia bacterium]